MPESCCPKRADSLEAHLPIKTSTRARHSLLPVASSSRKDFRRVTDHNIRIAGQRGRPEQSRSWRNAAKDCPSPYDFAGRGPDFGDEAKKRFEIRQSRRGLEFVTPDAVCKHTGLRLNDIWRYFRHTWVNSYRSVPGRSMMVLVRDAAGPNHLIIGLAALGSSVVQSSVRDAWIGWDSNGAVRNSKV